MKVSMREAESQLWRLGRLAREGEEVVITRAGEPYLRLEPYREHRGERKLGGYEGQFWMSPDFDDPIPELEEAIENSKIFQDEQ